MIDYKTFLLATVFFLPVAASAQQPAPIQIQNLGPATTPLSPNDLLIVSQANVARKVSYSSLGVAGGGTVTSITCGPGLAGGIITVLGTCELAPIAADTLLGNPTGSTAVPIAIPLGTNLSFSGGTLNATGGGGVTSVVCTDALSGGTITVSGTCDIAAISGHTLLMNTTGSPAVPTATPIGAHLTDSSGTLNATGFVSGVTCENGLSGGAITTNGTCGLATIPNGFLFGNDTGVTAIPGTIVVGANLSLSSGTLNASGSTGVSEVVCNGGLTGGTITSSGTCSLGAITLSGAVTGTGTSSIATAFETITSGYLIGNNTGGSAAAGPASLVSIMDVALGAAQGNILYRGASAWAVLAPGTSGQKLVTGGSGANPAWKFEEKYTVISFSNVSPVASSTQPLIVSSKQTSVIIDSVDAVTAGTSSPAFTVQLVTNSATLTCGGGTTITVGTVEATSTCTVGNTLAAGSSLNAVFVVTSGTNGPAGVQMNYHVVP